jgi:hypothetical protein
MRAQLTIDTENSAFGDTREEAAIEVARILEATARKLRDSHRPEPLGSYAGPIGALVISE